MQKFVPALVFSVALLSGCGSTPAVPTPKASEQAVAQPTPEQPATQPIKSQKINLNPMKNKIEAIDTQVASKEMYTYQLPIANANITKREVSGFLDEDKTGKISRVVEGVATTKEHFYFENNELVGVKLETVVEGKTSVKEMLFENKKITSLKIDGVEDMKNPNIGYLEESELSDAEAILTEFSDRQSVNE